MDDADAIKTIWRRQDSLRRISAECTVLLVDGDGSRASLDGVLVAERPNRLRIRAWKLGQAVFDLILKDDQVWLYQPRNGRRAEGFDAQHLPHQQLKEAWDLLGPAYFETAVPIENQAGQLSTRGTLFGNGDIDCDIERSTLTPTRFTFPGSNEGPSQQLLLSHYVSIESHVWPGRVQLLGPQGSLIIRFNDTEINGDIPSTAFTPPRRAKRIP
jgi:hypothetical protein